MLRSLLALLCLLLSSGAALAQTPQRVWITEFVTSRVEASAAMATLPSAVRQPTLNLTSGAAQTSAAFKADTRYIRVVCEVQCAVSASGIATTADILMPKLVPEYFGVLGIKTISVIAAP